MCNYLLADIFINGKQELLDNPVQIVWSNEYSHISNAGLIYINPIIKQDYFFIYLN